MPQNDIFISTSDLRNADEATYREVNELLELLRAERWPEEPPVSLEERISNWQNLPALFRATWWMARWARGAGGGPCLFAGDGDR